MTKANKSDRKLYPYLQLYCCHFFPGYAPTGQLQPGAYKARGQGLED